MTVVHPRWGIRAALTALLAAALLALSAGASTEIASAHNNCTLQATAPYKSPSGAQIRGVAIISCDSRHELVKACVAVERFEGGQWETFGEAPNKCNPNANAFSAKAQIGRPCVSGSYRTVNKSFAEGANGHIHSGTWRTGAVFITCPPTALTGLSADDIAFLAG